MQLENNCALRKRTLWEKHGSWAILLLVACSMGQAGFQYGVYTMHTALEDQAVKHKQEMVDLSLRWLTQMEQLEPADAEPKNQQAAPAE